VIGPVAENIQDQHAKTAAEFSNLSASRTAPTTPAATGQQLTHYHSFFSSLLSWNNPRASGIAYLSIVLFIFAARYLDVLRYAMKLTWVTLAITVAAEATGKALFSTGFTSQIRPKKYYTVRKETLDSFMGDVTELINFFVIESQRIVFAENVFASAAVSRLIPCIVDPANITPGLRRSFPVLLSDQDRPILGSHPHLHVRPLPHPSHLQDEPRAHRPPRQECLRHDQHTNRASQATREPPRRTSHREHKAIRWRLCCQGSGDDR
jgi:Reticulon